MTNLTQMTLHLDPMAICSAMMSSLCLLCGASATIIPAYCNAGTNSLDSAILSFPKITADRYRPDVAAQCANMLIAAGEGAACSALDRAATADLNATSEDALSAYHAMNQSICLLTRLLFVPTNSESPLRAPRLGALQSLPVLSMKQAKWPNLPFVVENGIPLSVNLGYAGSGMPERAQDYLHYCERNGQLRPEAFSTPTFLTASNALSQIFVSQAWKALKWSDRDFGFSYTLNEEDTKKRLWQQVQNLNRAPFPHH